jgi:hypothetical protein
MEPAPGVKLTDCDESGVDLTLIRWFLSLTPAERLEHLDDHVRGLLRMVPTLYESQRHSILNGTGLSSSLYGAQPPF